jgi:biotin synthase
MGTLTRDDILAWLREEDPARLRELATAADQVRRAHVGDAVHLRGLIEVSNHCVRSCGYCGVRAGNPGVQRYRMTHDEVMACVREAVALGYGTVVMQAGEDPGLTTGWVSDVVRRIKRETPLAVTLSLGERTEEDFRAWRDAGADRYLLRFETSDRALYRLIHPSLGSRVSDRMEILGSLRRLGYEVGSGIMVGIPGQGYNVVADDVMAFRELDLDMVGVGPYISHPDTPLGRGEWVQPLPPGEQVPNTEAMVLKVVALTRLVCPQANIPSTTALATINRQTGRERGLASGANVVMPNLTPTEYREKYEIYPGKACINETATTCAGCMAARIRSVGRVVGTGQGGRLKP